jgi:hypothetical protein
MSAFFIIAAIVVIFAFGREAILLKQTGWDRLSQKYPCRAAFAGKYKGCWWAQFTVVGPKSKTVVNVGRMSRWPIRLEFPPYWIGADPQGLYVKRNAWNLRHSPLLIPWNKIQTANEITYQDLVRNSSPGAALVRQPMTLHPFMAVAKGIGGQLLELKLSDPSLSIVAQLAVFEEARRFLSGKLRLLNSQGIESSTTRP